MQSNTPKNPNLILIRGACLWLLMALLLAWCMVALNFNVLPFKLIFAGKFTRLLQAHIDFLLMAALILGFYAAKVPLPWHVRWSMVIGAFTNSSLFLLMSIFPILDDHKVPPPFIFQLYLFASLLTTSYGFGKASVIVFKSTFRTNTL
jgi:hypothetical protein